MNQLADFFEANKEGIIFNSPPAVEIEKVPDQFKAESIARNPVYSAMLDLMPKWPKKVRFLDFYQMTSTCRMSNCTSDGGHRARFVNRWKAQMILNTICSAPVDPDLLT